MAKHALAHPHLFLLAGLSVCFPAVPLFSLATYVFPLYAAVDPETGQCHVILPRRAEIGDEM